MILLKLKRNEEFPKESFPKEGFSFDMKSFCYFEFLSLTFNCRLWHVTVLIQLDQSVAFTGGRRHYIRSLIMRACVRNFIRKICGWGCETRRIENASTSLSRSGRNGRNWCVQIHADALERGSSLRSSRACSSVLSVVRLRGLGSEFPANYRTSWRHVFRGLRRR